MSPRKKLEKVSWEALTQNTGGVSVNQIPDSKEFQKHYTQMEREDGHIDERDMWQSIEDQPEHPVYPAYEWDDKEAGAKYRDEQSRLMIRTIHTVWKDKNDQEHKTRAIVSVPSSEDPKKKEYRTFTSTLTDMNALEYQQLQCLKGLVAWRRKWRILSTISEMAPHLEVVDGVIRAMEQTVAATDG